MSSIYIARWRFLSHMSDAPNLYVAAGPVTNRDDRLRLRAPVAHIAPMRAVDAINLQYLIVWSHDMQL